MKSDTNYTVEVSFLVVITQDKKDILVFKNNSETYRATNHKRMSQRVHKRPKGVTMFPSKLAEKPPASTGILWELS